MTKQDFEQKARNIVFNSLLREINQSFKVNAVNKLALNLILKLQIKIEAVRADVPNVTNKNLHILFNNTIMDIQTDDPSTLVITFMYSENQKFKSLLNSIEENSILFTFGYLTNIYRFMNGTNTDIFYISKLEKLSNKANAYEFIEVNAIKQAMEQAYTQISNSNTYPEKKIKQLYELLNFKLLEPNDLLTVKATKLSKKYKNLNFKAEQYNILDRQEDFTVKMHGYQAGNEGTHDTIITNLRDALLDDISSGAKGNAIGELFAAQFKEVKINTKWFKKLKSSFTSYVNKQTNNYDCGWNNLNTVYRQVFKSPKKKYLNDKIDVILSIDQSGSISTYNLGMVLYLIKKNKKRIGSLYVLIHDAAVTHEFKFDNLDEVSQSEIQKTVGVRFTNGGTSMVDTFRHVQKYTKNKDISKYILIMFSDFYADVEDAWYKYSNIKKLKTYFLNEHGGRGNEVMKILKNQLNNNITTVNLP